MRFFLVFLLFSLPEFILRNYVDSYIYHSIGLFPEFLPLIIGSVLACLIYFKPIIHGNFKRTYFQLVGASISGLLTIRIILFIQWYWFIHPEYREITGDMSEGLGFSIFFFIIGIFVISISYLQFILTLRLFSKNVDK